MGVWVDGHIGSRVSTKRSAALLELRLGHGSVNALDTVAYEEIHEAFTDVASTPEIGTVLLLGESDCFCAGQDTSDSAAIASDPEGYLNAAAQALISVTTSPATVVAGVRRFAIGAGLILATSADLLVVDEDARLLLPELQYGVVAGAAHVARWLGGPRAEKALMTGEPIDPREFAPHGAAVVPGSRVDDTARELAQSLAARGSSVNRLAKAPLAHERNALAQQYRDEIRTTLAAGTIDFSPPSR